MRHCVCALLTGQQWRFSLGYWFCWLNGGPHIVRLWLAAINRKVLTLSALLGALFFSFAADINRSIMHATAECQLVFLTGLAGGIAFVFLMRQRRLNVSL